MNSGQETHFNHLAGAEEPKAVEGGEALKTNAPLQRTPAEVDEYVESMLTHPPVDPWPQEVIGVELLGELRSKVTRPR